MTDLFMIQFRSPRGLYEAPVEIVQACTDYYAEWETDKLGELVSQTSEDDRDRYGHTPRVALLIMLAEWGQYGSHQASWHDHKECQGFAPNESVEGWSCYTHNLFRQAF